MRKVLFVSLFSAIALSTFFFLLPEEKQTEKFAKKARNKMSKQDRVDLAIEQEVALTRDPALGDVPRERLLFAADEVNKRIARNLSSRTSVTGINWIERGPDNVGGRTRALLFDLNDAVNGYKKVWAGGVGGGLWYINDITAATPVWNKVDDFMDNMAITCIVQNPLNTQEIYVGTGEGWLNADAIRGLGIWKTTNGGTSWTRLTTTANFSYVNDLLFDNSGNLYAAVRQYYGSDAAGIQKSTDGGATWTQVLGAPVLGTSNRGADLELAANGDIYASIGVGGNNNGGIYISDKAVNTTNTGNAGTWVNVTPNTSGTIATPANFWERIELATAPSDANILYALFEGYGSNNCTHIGQYNRSTNTWTLRTAPLILDQNATPTSNFTRGQAWYDMIAAVDPNNANTLYIGGVDALRSDDGGATWNQMTAWSLYLATGYTSAQNVHADHHAIVYAPGSSGRAVWGTDGGVHYTETANSVVPIKPTFISKNKGYNVTQYYAAAAHPTNPNYFLAGAQDNGTQKFTTAGMNTTTDASGGDGAFCHIDQDNGNVQITSYVYNNYYVSTNGGTSFTSRSFGNTGSFINPTDYDDADNKLYAGNTAGTYFRWNNPSTAGSSTTNVSVSAFSGASITHVTVSPLTPYRVYFGLNNGSIVRVDNANSGTSKTGTVIKGTASGSVSSIAIDPTNEDHMLMTYSNYGVTSVYESFNATQASPSWAAVEGNLPDMPIRWIVFDPRNTDNALVATELGIWSTDNLNGATTDWQPTNSGLANVRVDMLLYRNTDRTFIAATHGRGLFTASLPALTTPDINFVTGSTPSAELSSSSIGCRGYRDITVTMSIANAPTGDAVITINKAGGNALQGADYDITTNGNFNAPSNTLTFTSGSTANQTINIRIYNDVEVEGSETLTLGYTISGTTNAQAGGSFQTHTIGIDDDGDSAPLPPGPASATIGIGDNTTTNVQPFRGAYSDARTQMLYLASELTASGLNGGSITKLTLDVTSKATSGAYENFTIKLKNTSTATLTTGTFETGTTTVYGPINYSTLSGINEFVLTTPFTWNGTSNLLVEICFDNATALGTNDVVKSTVTSSSYMVFDRQNGASGCAIANSVYASYSGVGMLRPDLGLTISSTGTQLASTLNTTKTEYFTNSNDLYYYSSGSLIARVRNLSAHDYGCTQITVDRAGTGAEPFWNNNASNYLMSKTFHVAPATNNTSGQYEITLYFTEAEVQGWETATGQSWNNIQIVKVPSQIKNYSPATPNPDGAGVVQTATPVRGRLGTHYTLTYTFNNGFSGFGAGVAGTVLPVTLLNFEGKLQNNGVLLNWSTTNEINAGNFDIEKSEDGNNFRKIGSVNAVGNSTTKQEYSYLDRQISAVNYYRLRMNDKNGTSKLSQVITIKNNAAIQKMQILTNPFNNYIEMKFAKTPGIVSLQLVNANGVIVLQKQINNPSERIRWELNNSTLSNGTYILKALVDGKAFSQKLIKK